MVPGPDLARDQTSDFGGGFHGLIVCAADATVCAMVFCGLKAMGDIFKYAATNPTSAEQS